jgi:hypothetical protein
MIQSRRPTIDPVVLEIISHELQSIPDQVEADLTRTAFSPLIYEYKDYAVGLIDAQGRSIALARQGGPGFVVNLIGLGAREAMARHGDTLKPGDVIITNNPATIGHHLNDVVMCAPIFDQGGRIAAFMGIIAHWIDIGGRYPNSCSGTDTTEIFQEGLRLNSVHLRREGRPVAEVYSIIEANSRMPEALLGDVEAQLAGCMKGAGLYAELMARHGAETLTGAVAEIWQRSASEARAAVAAIPDGSYAMECFLDNDGVTLDQTIPIRVAVHISGSRFTVDFSKMSPQVPGPFNSGRYGGGEACARIAFKYLISPSSAANEGSFAPLEIILPARTLLSAEVPAPLGRYSVPLPTVIDCIIGAMAKAMPTAFSDSTPTPAPFSHFSIPSTAVGVQPRRGMVSGRTRPCFMATTATFRSRCRKHCIRCKLNLTRGVPIRRVPAGIGAGWARLNPTWLPLRVPHNSLSNAMVALPGGCSEDNPEPRVGSKWSAKMPDAAYCSRRASCRWRRATACMSLPAVVGATARPKPAIATPCRRISAAA